MANTPAELRKRLRKAGREIRPALLTAAERVSALVGLRARPGRAFGLKFDTELAAYAKTLEARAVVLNAPEESATAAARSRRPTRNARTKRPNSAKTRTISSPTPEGIARSVLRPPHAERQGRQGPRL